MNRKPKLFIVLLRVAAGWFLFYQGISAMLNSGSTILPLIKNPGTFPQFYAYVSSPSIVLSLSYIIKGALIVIGAMIILGLFVRLATLIGTTIVLFFYFPLLTFPYVTGGYYIVDGHIIFALVLLYLYAARAGEYFGLGTMFRVSRY